MKKLLNKGRSLIAIVSVFAILAVSMFSVLTGVNLTASAVSGSNRLQGITDVWEHNSELNSTYDDQYLVSDRVVGTGKADDPYIISTAEQLASAAAARFKDAEGNYIDTAGLYFKVADGVTAFYMNGGVTVANLTGAEQVKAWFEDSSNNPKQWWTGKKFKGTFDGNGVTVYGVYCTETYAGLFHKVDGATIKNLAVANSYFKGTEMAGAIAGGVEWVSGDVYGDTSYYNCAVTNNYVTATSGDAGAMVGHLRKTTITASDILVYGNIVETTKKTGIFANVNNKVIVSNVIAIGTTPWALDGSWNAKHVDTGCFIDIYTDQSLQELIDYDPSRNSQTNLDKYNIKQLTVGEMTGAAAKEVITSLDEAVWFFNTATHPQLRIFHEITGTAVSVDGHNNEKDACCSCDVITEGLVLHTYVGDGCIVCGYTYPCANGHSFAFVPAKPTSTEAAGNIAYNYCSQCQKKYAEDASINAPLSSAISDDAVIIPQILPYDTWDGQYDDYFWMNNAGDGSPANPFVIETAEQLASVVCARLKYDATKPAADGFDISKYTLSGSTLDTSGISFKVKDGIKAFYMNGDTAVSDLKTAADVKAYFEEKPGYNWWVSGIFKGNFNGNGATVYGLYATKENAGLFPLLGPDVVITNISLANSYIKSGVAGGIFGQVQWYSGISNKSTVNISNSSVVNCYIESTSSTDAGVAGGHIRELKLNVKNFLAYSNLVVNSTSNHIGGLIGAGWGSTDEISDSVFIGTAPYSLGADKKRARGENYKNVYTDQDLTAGETLVQVDISDFKYEDNQIKKLVTEQMLGANAPENMTGLDFGTAWFVTDGAIKLRAFHEFTGTAVNVDGHNNEKDVCCETDSVYTGIVPHVYVGENCSICGYKYPCTNGHSFEDVPAIETSTEAPGRIAHKYCAQCQKKYADDAAIDAPISSALSEDDVVIPQILPYDTWDGTCDDYFWMNNEGDGSPANPFIIETAEQLASVVCARLKYDETKPAAEGFDISKYTLSGNTLDTTGVFFKVKTGMTAFYMNGDTSVAKLKNADEVKAYFEKTPGYNWWIGGTFKGNFNGNGTTVYGLYATKESAGLFQQVGPDVVIKNITLANSYIKSEFAGGIFGQVVWYSGISNVSSVTVRNSAVVNCYIESTSSSIDAGVVGGHIRELKLKVKNFLAYNNSVVNNTSEHVGGIVGAGWASIDEIYDSVFIGTTPYSLGTDKKRARGDSFKNVYTDQDLTAGETLVQNDVKDFKYVDTQITKLETAKMLGSNAQTNMPALDWVSMWKANDDGYPTPRLLSIKDYAPGYVWTGEVAVEFPAGEGTKNNPYKISTPEYLALMLNMDSEGLYFELTNDIIINNTLDETAKQWFTSAEVKEFNGTLEGNGKTISGLYYNDVPENAAIGLIPVKGSGTVLNLKVANSYINVPANSYGAAVIGSIIDGAQKPIYMHGITVEDTVVVTGAGVGAGLVAKCGNSILRINNCISEATIETVTAKAGIVAVTGGGISVKNTISAKAAPFGSADDVTATNVYTDAQSNVKLDGVKTLSTADLQGENVKANTALDFDGIWATTSEYPVISAIINTANGTEGDVWTGDIAESYAGGSGTADDPFIITTGEMLARCVTKDSDKAKVIKDEQGNVIETIQLNHFKLGADIYLNDVNSPLWEDKIGCTEWFNSKTGALWQGLSNGSFDGDGYVIYGMYYNRQHLVSDSAFNGLFATIGENAQIKNVGISDAYLGCSKFKGDDFNEFCGAFVGYIVDWDGIDLDISDAFSVKETTSDPEYYSRMPVISNCFVDHKSYLSGRCVGGFVGGAAGTFRVENSIFTGSLDGNDKSTTAGIAGQDMCHGAHYIDTVSFPQTCDRPLGGSSNSDWRTSPNDLVTTATDVYYFSMYRVYNTLTKISKPEQRIGEAAMKAMPGLDWSGNADDGDEDLWRVVDGGTPILTIFDKHRDNAEIFSDKTFTAPEVTVSLVTGTTEVEFEPLVGRMYSKMTLPTPTRPGYKFTGWYPHSNLSVEYPYDYFPPRNLNLYAGWEPVGVICNFESYTDTIWDYDDTRWVFNKPGAKGGYKNNYVRNGSKSMHLLDTSSEDADVLLNYDPMLEIGQSYEMTFWVTTDKADNPATKLSLVHNSKPVYLDTGIAIEDMVTVEKLTVGEWTQYKYSFKALTKWVSIRATGNSSLYFDDIIIAPIDTEVNNTNIKQLSQSSMSGQSGTTGSATDEFSPQTNDNVVSVAIFISAIMACAAVVVVSRKSLVEIIED